MDAVVETTDIVVVGAGPTGLLLAAMVAERGLGVVVLESRGAPDPLPRANGVVGAGVLVLERRGLYRDLVGGDRSVRGWARRAMTGNLGRRPRPAPWFGYAGYRLPLRRLADNPVYALPVPQPRLESVLEADASRQGADVRRESTAVHVEQDDDAVTVHYDRPDGPHRIRAAYLVGCDGAHSRVRAMAGVGFVGTSRHDAVTRHGHVTIPRAALTRAGSLRVPAGTPLSASARSLRPYVTHRTEHGVLTFGAFAGGTHVVSTVEWDPPAEVDQAPMSIGELGTSASRVLGFPLQLDEPHGPGPFQLRRVTNRSSRLAETFRRHRIVLAGDAAHVFSGFGAPAINAAILDVADLAPRLAAAVRGEAPAATLDAYSSGRHAAARRTAAFGNAQEDLLAPGPEIDARRAAFERRLGDVRQLRQIAEGIAGH